jgi:hypothetical protein
MQAFARGVIACVSSCLALALGLAACTDSPDRPAARATWYQDVGPIVSRRCMSCHQDGGIAPFSLTDAGSVRAHAARAIDQIDRGEMPPWNADDAPDCAPRFGWVDDPRLTDGEKQALRDWISDGFALGVEQALPAPPSTDLPGVTTTMQPAVPFVTEGDRDQFTCFVLDPGATQLSWMTGMQVRPGNRKVVHHVVLTEVPPGPELTELLAEHPLGTPYDCGGMATPGKFLLGIWTPGNQPMQTPPDLAVPIVAGARIVMQIHYHPAGAVNDPDVTAVDLRLSPTAPRKVYLITAFGNERTAPNLLPDPDDAGPPQFLVPRNAADHVERMRRAVPELGGLSDVRIYSVNPHMHLVGTHIAARIERPAARGGDPQSECLANGGWNFDWQRTYVYDAPLDDLPTLQTGDIVDVTCHWNNTIENPFVQRMLNDSHLPPQPIDLTLGEQTSNEMCVEIFGLAVTLDMPIGAGRDTALLQLQAQPAGSVR